MILSYGGFTFPIGWPAVFIERKPELNDAFEQLAIVETWTITGALLASSPPALLQQIAQFEQAFRRENQDLVLRLPDGSRQAGGLLNANCVGGTRVVSPPSYPEGKGTEFVNRRTFQLAISGRVATPGAIGRLVSFAETISFHGNGGPATAHLEPLNGPPIKQVTRQQTLYRATQSGRAVGYLAYPTPRTPIWPGAALNDRVRVGYIAPKRSGNDGSQAYTHFGVEWSYQFESVAPLIGYPGIW